MAFQNHRGFHPVNRRSGRGGSFSDWEVWKKLLAANIAVFVLQMFITRPSTDEDLQKHPYFDAYIEEVIAEDSDNVNDEAIAEMAAEIQAEANREHGENTVSEESERGGDDHGSVSDGNEAASGEDKLLDAKQLAVEIVAASKAADRIAAEESKRQLMEMLREAMPSVSVVQEWLQLDSEKVMRGEVWRLVTCGFCHDTGQIWHILGNMLFLFWFGRRLEQLYGSGEFTAFYFAALLCSSFAYIGLDMYTGDSMPAIGASGAVFGVVALYALLYPYERIYVYFLFPVQIRFLVLLYFLFDLYPVLRQLRGDNASDGIAHAAHIGGAVFGFFYWYRSWSLFPLFDRVSAYFRSTAPSIQPRQRPQRGRQPDDDRPSTIPFAKSNDDRKPKGPAADQDAGDLDAILDKIAAQGRESLTPEEEAMLKRLSEQMRKQRSGGDDV